MAALHRASKYKNIYCDSPRPESTYTNLRLSTVAGEQNFIKANPLFFAVGLQGGGGPVAVHRLDQTGKWKVDVPTLAGHAGPVLDFEFNPFNDHMIATASEDSTIKVWSIPEGGLTTNITTPIADLTNHVRKVTLLRSHPTANGVLASTSADQTVKIWDIEQQAEISSLNDVHDQLIQDLVWDHHGNLLATSSKDKHVRVIDGRTNTVANKIESVHDGTKSIKLTFLGNTNKLFTVGFTKTSMRQMKIWDPRNTSEEIFRLELDNAAGVIMPFFDADTNVIYLAGKGDGNVRVYEINSEGDGVTAVTDFRSSVSAKGMAFMPKRSLNVLANETARLLKLTSNSVEPLSFVVPRKAEGFQEDIFPDCPSGEPSHSAEEWLAGSDMPPATMSLNPTSKSVKTSTASSRVASVKHSVPGLLVDLEKANARIKVLEERLTAAGLSIE